MKIISQSTVAHRPAYFHLAYLAASHMAPHQGLLVAGMLPLLLGCVLSLRFGRGDTNAKGVGKITPSLRKDNPKSLLAGLLCLVVGTIIICLSLKAGPTRYAHPLSLTQVRMHSLSSHIGRHLAEGEPIPENVAAFASQWGLPRSEIQDGWFNEMRLMKTTEGKMARYDVVSAGKDKAFGTGDDLRLAIPYPQEE